MKKYVLEIASALGIGEIIGIPAVTNGVTDATWLQTVIGAATVLLIWALKHESLIKETVSSVEELIHDEKTHAANIQPKVEPSPTAFIPPPAVTAAEIKDELLRAASPVVDQAISNAPLTAGQRQAIAGEWAKVSAADPKPVQ